MSTKLRTVGLIVVVIALLGVGAALKPSWLPHGGQGVTTTIQKWFAPAAQPTLLVAADLDCDWKLDGKPQGRLRAEQVLTLTTTPGQHFVEAKTTDGKDGWRGVVEVHAPEQRVTAIGLDDIRQDRLVREKMTEQERLASENARTAKRIALANQAAIESAAEETRRSARQSARNAEYAEAMNKRAAVEAKQAAEKGAREQKILAARRELRAETIHVNAEGNSSYGYSKAFSEEMAVASAKTKLSYECRNVGVPHARLNDVPPNHVGWILGDYSIDRANCDQQKGASSSTTFYSCLVYLKGSCYLIGLP